MARPTAFAPVANPIKPTFAPVRYLVQLSQEVLRKVANSRSCDTVYLLVAKEAIFVADVTFPVFATCCNCAFDNKYTAPAASASATESFFVATA